MPALMLYHKTGCPYCHKVLSFLESEGITVSMRNITENADYRQELINAAGKQQVPCLIIDGQALFESDDIIKWFQENKGELQE